MSTLNISSILPSSIAFSTVEVRKLDSEQDLIWETFDESLVSYRDGSFIDVRIFEKTTILIIGVIEAPNVEAESFSANLEPGGMFELNWNSTGEINNDYILGWNLYQKIVSVNGGTVFPSSNKEYNEVAWLDLTNNTFRAFVPIEAESWYDNIPLSKTSAHHMLLYRSIEEEFHSMTKLMSLLIKMVMGHLSVEIQTHRQYQFPNFTYLGIYQ